MSLIHYIHEIRHADRCQRSRPDSVLTVAQVEAHPAYKTINFPLTPTKSGFLNVAKDRGGVVSLYYEVHGTGPIHMLVSFRLHDAFCFCQLFKLLVY